MVAVTKTKLCVRPELFGGTLEGSEALNGTCMGETSMVLGVELSGPILSAPGNPSFCEYVPVVIIHRLYAVQIQDTLFRDASSKGQIVQGMQRIKEDTSLGDISSWH